MAMKKIAIGVLIAGMACLAAALGFGLVGASAASQLEREIVIGKNGDGSCTVTTSPEIIQDAKKNDKITWHVTNNCDQAKTVSVGNFKHKEKNDQKKSVLDLDSFPQIPPGGSRDIGGKVKVLPQADYGTYKYDILIDGEVAEDPVLVING